MTAPDPAWVEAGAKAWRALPYGVPLMEIVPAVIAAVEPLIRADERERCEGMPPPIGGLDVARLWKKDTAHAEAVAARLVEVVCRQEQQIDDLVEHVGDFASDVLVLTGERDAARAEVRALLHIRTLMEQDRDAAARETMRAVSEVQAERDAAAADHDDLCPISVGPESLPCACYLISRVRENEQERHSQALSDVESRVRRELAEEIAQAIEREGGDYCRETCTCVVMALAMRVRRLATLSATLSALEGVMGR